mmetsp:Transcript_50437/g.93802  ORF Transcript_50437/g.93802 Transcript_50437/m.93802 type:complete len:1373 (+) Transcript_50437:93-4211(+)
MVETKTPWTSLYDRRSRRSRDEEMNNSNGSNSLEPGKSQSEGSMESDHVPAEASSTSSHTSNFGNSITAFGAGDGPSSGGISLDHSSSSNFGGKTHFYGRQPSPGIAGLFGETEEREGGASRERARDRFRKGVRKVTEARGVVEEFIDPARERQMREAVMKEQTVSTQRRGRDSVKPLPLLSELRVTNPGTFLLRRAMYRAESALESVSNRVYLLIVMVVVLLMLSLLFFWGTSVLMGGGDEALYLRREAKGYHEHDDDNGFGATVGSDEGAEGLLVYMAWLTWCFFVDPGAHTERLDPLKYQWSRASAALISIVGIIFFSFLLGFVVEILQSFLARVTEGRSSVIEEGHYLILGYSEKCIAVIAELAAAMESDGGGVVIVLADYPTKTEFDLLVATHLQTIPGLTNGGKTRVVFRPGNPLITSNLLRLQPEKSRAIVVLSDTRQDADHADASVLHIILSLKSILGSRNMPLPQRRPSLFEQFDERNNTFHSNNNTQTFYPNNNPARVSSADEPLSMSSSISKSSIEEEVSPTFEEPGWSIHTTTHSNASGSHTPQASRLLVSSEERVVSEFSGVDDDVGASWPISPPLKTQEANSGQGGVPTTTTASSNFGESLSGEGGDQEDPSGSRRSLRFSRGISMRRSIAEHQAAEALIATEQAEAMRKAYKGHIIAEVMDMDNKPIIQISGGNLVELVVVHDIIGRMLAKSTMQPNIRRIYDDLLGFDGSEFYFARHPELNGCTFQEASLRLVGAVLVGVKRGPTIILNPESKLPQNVTGRRSDRHDPRYSRRTGYKFGNFMLHKDDEIIVIAEDDSSYEILDLPVFDCGTKGRTWPPWGGKMSAQEAYDIKLNAAADAAFAAEAPTRDKRAQEKAHILAAQAAEDIAEAAEKAKVETGAQVKGGGGNTQDGGGGGEGRPIKTTSEAMAFCSLALTAGSDDSTGGNLGGDNGRVTQEEEKMSTQSPSLTSTFSSSSHLMKQKKDHDGIYVLMCGWRRDVKDMLALLEQTLPSESTVHILSEKPKAFVESYLKDHCSEFTNIKVLFSLGRADVRRRLVQSNCLGFSDPDTADVDMVMVVADESKEKDVLLSDSQTLAGCLLVRDVQSDEMMRRDVSLSDLNIDQLEALHVSCPMTAEIMDVATRATIEENPAIQAIADFIVVDDLAARLIAAVADRREVAAVLGELLGPDPKSQDIFIIEATSLLYEDEVVSFRAAACVDVGNVNPRSESELGVLVFEANSDDEQRQLHHRETMQRSFSAPKGGMLSKLRSTRINVGSKVEESDDGVDEARGGRKASPVSFAELATRAAAPPRHGILLGYIKATWDRASGRAGELTTVFNPLAKGAPLYWHAKDFLIVMSIENHQNPNSRRKFTVVR